MSMVKRGKFNLPNKGAICLRFELKDRPLFIITSNLTSDQEKISRRRDDFHSMMREFFFDKLSQSCIPANKLDYCFLMGDLNLGMWMEMQRKDIESGLLCGKFIRLLSFDELNMERYQRRSFDEFEEMMITWGQTYRINVGSHVFDTRLPECMFRQHGGTKFEVISKLFVDIQKTREGFNPRILYTSWIIPITQFTRLGSVICVGWTHYWRFR
ncbi:MAG: hypothetical protein EZS28_030273 [Streblomastix strix]|uniref:Inositol polyphosphate-related phosphatase domain-containing protein n=1 Tax=Streblomastix strix TaxID=222440 RepID=A0A5J4UVN8_9EUKA|nr:MAG: hypothetical protein EZS28_030273 [Streblomastix strix]